MIQESITFYGWLSMPARKTWPFALRDGNLIEHRWKGVFAGKFLKPSPKSEKNSERNRKSLNLPPHCTLISSRCRTCPLVPILKILTYFRIKSCSGGGKTKRRRETSAEKFFCYKSRGKEICSERFPSFWSVRQLCGDASDLNVHLWSR